MEEFLWGVISTGVKCKPYKSVMHDRMTDTTIVTLSMLIPLTSDHPAGLGSNWAILVASGIRRSRDCSRRDRTLRFQFGGTFRRTTAAIRYEAGAACDHRADGGSIRRFLTHTCNIDLVISGCIDWKPSASNQMLMNLPVIWLPSPAITHANRC